MLIFAQKHENVHLCSFCSLCMFLHRGWSLCSFLCLFCSLFAQHQIKARKNSLNYVEVKLRKHKLWILFSYRSPIWQSKPVLKKSWTVWKLNYVSEMDLYIHLTFTEVLLLRQKKTEIASVKKLLLSIVVISQTHRLVSQERLSPRAGPHSNHAIWWVVVLTFIASVSHHTSPPVGGVGSAWQFLIFWIFLQ